MLRTFLRHKWFWSVTKQKVEYQNFFFERFCRESNKRIFKIVTVATALVTSKLVNFSTRQTQGLCQGLPSVRYRVSPPTLRVCTDGRADESVYDDVTTKFSRIHRFPVSIAMWLRCKIRARKLCYNLCESSVL